MGRLVTELCARVQSDMPVKRVLVNETKQIQKNLCKKTFEIFL
jgi:hypothetical protein